MPTSNSETSIANLALAEISSHTIDNLSDDTEEARWCNRFYGQCRDEMLRNHPWNFAIKRAALSEVFPAPPFEWGHGFQLPADYISMYQLNRMFIWESPGLYQVEAGQLLTNEAAANIRYVFQQTDATKFDPLFVTALSILLASRICKPITGNDSTALIARYEQIALPKAMKFDAREDKPHVISPIATSELIARRFVSDIGSS